MASDLPQQLRRHVLLESKLELGTLSLQLLGDPRCLQAGERRVADAEDASLRLCRATRLVDRGIDLGKRRPGPLEQSGAGGRQLHAPRRSHEQHQPELTLQVADRARQRRLRHVQTLGRAPKMQLLSYGDEVAQLPQLDRKVHRGGY